MADQLQAEPVRTRLLSLARVANITLEPGSGSPTRTRPNNDPPVLRRFSTLTDREHQVLEHIAAGETYAEIAVALFISEKTVSSHVSHLLTKTGATNRIELARLAITPK